MSWSFERLGAPSDLTGESNCFPKPPPSRESRFGEGLEKIGESPRTGLPRIRGARILSRGIAAAAFAGVVV
ncbi:MAG TPA: hypothetical protein VGH90_05500, partial [Chthoniobacteraceae bacterium]